jgi:fidgetin-like protein 1
MDYTTNPPLPATAEDANRPPSPTPVIRESLRRKFQPPKRQGGAGNGTNSSDGGNGNGSSHSHSGIAKHSTQKASNGKEEIVSENEDELPEELKLFGKELVDKIEAEIMDQGEPVTFADIAGLLDVKQIIYEVICWPMQRPDLFTGLRRAPNGLLLYGPPGTGKTLIGKAIAHESGATFFSISSSSLTSKWIGEGEKLVRTLFAVAAYREPSVVFIDEIDSLLTQRKSDENEASRRIKTEFLVQLDGTSRRTGRVLCIGATNRPQELDEAARRRFIKRLYIPLPAEADRLMLLKVLLDKNTHCLTDGDFERLARETEGFSGADLHSLCTEAAMGPLRKLGSQALAAVTVNEIPPISFSHCQRARRSMKASVAPADLKPYEEWDELYGSRRAEDGDDDDDDGGDKVGDGEAE